MKLHSRRVNHIAGSWVENGGPRKAVTVGAAAASLEAGSIASLRGESAVGQPEEATCSGVGDFDPRV